MAKLTAEDKAILKAIKKYNPVSEQHLKAMGLNPQFLSSGISRKAYKLSANLVIKFAYNFGEKQSSAELKNIERIKKDPICKPLRKYTPKVYFGNEITGTIVMQFYPNSYEDSQKNDRKRIKVIGMFFRLALISDLHEGNFRMTEKNRLVAIDLGFCH